MKVLMIGRHEMLYATIQKLASEGKHQITAVITAPAAPEYKRTEKDFQDLSISCGASFTVANKINDDVLQLAQNSKADIALSVNWVSVINSDLISLFPKGILNAHFGDLPRFRGNAVANWGILLGEPELVMSIHKMNPGELDTGDLLIQKSMPLSDETTIADVNEYAEINVPILFSQALDDIEGNILQPVPQELTGKIGFRCYPRLPRDGLINWEASALKINRLVNALTKPYSGAFTYYRGQNNKLEKLYIWKSRLVQGDSIDKGIPGHVIMNDKSSGESWIFTGQGILAICLASHDEHGELFSPGKLWKSTRMRLGMDIQHELFQLARKHLS